MDTPPPPPERRREQPVELQGQSTFLRRAVPIEDEKRQAVVLGRVAYRLLALWYRKTSSADWSRPGDRAADLAVILQAEFPQLYWPLTQYASALRAGMTAHELYCSYVGGDFRKLHKVQRTRLFLRGR